MAKNLTNSPVAPRRGLPLWEKILFAVFIFAALAFIAGWEKSFSITFFEWFAVDGFRVSADAFFNPLSALMVLMVTFVSSLIHVYSVGYMRDDEDYA